MSRVFVIALVIVSSMSVSADWTSTPGQTVTTDKIGVGTTTPESNLHVATEAMTGRRGVLVQQSSDSVNSAFVIFRKGRGTITAPLAVQSFDGLGTIYSEAHDGSGFKRTGAFIKFTAEGTIATDFIPTSLSFGTGDSGVGNERMRITSAGAVGIGTQTPLSELHLATSTPSTLRNLTVDYFTNDANSTLLTARKARGTQSAPQALQNGDNIVNLYPMGHDGTQFINSARIRFQVDGAVSPGSVPTAFQILTGASGSGVERVRVTSAGDVGIGIGGSAPVARLHVGGNAHFDGTVTGTYIKAHYQDVAEWVPANADLAPGTVVVLDAAVGNGVMASHRPYDTSVAGVVSEQPGIILGEEGTSKEQVATTGRVRVKVDASRGPIAVGDLLVTSDKPGYAMRSTPIDIGAALIHRPGTIVGKALEPLARGEGEILVLLSLQ
ncbi:MAG TPA: hypothetical protein VF883_03290 [Thermoanaerobaculia bacterium]|jgi:hypothetical protein